MKKIFVYLLLASLFCSCEQIKKTITPWDWVVSEERIKDDTPDPTERQNAVNLFLAKSADFYPEEKHPVIRQKLLAMDGDLNFICPVLDPDKMLLYSIFGGVFGIDRFILGEKFWGAVKFLTGGGFGILWLYDVFTIKSRTREKNYEQFEHMLSTTAINKKESVPLSFSSIRKITFDSYHMNNLRLYENHWFKLYHPNYCLIDSTHNGNNDPLFQNVVLASNFDVDTDETDLLIYLWADPFTLTEYNHHDLRQYADVAVQLRGIISQHNVGLEYMGCVVAEDSLKIDSYPASLRVYKYKKDDSYIFSYAFFVYIPQSRRVFNIYANVKERSANLLCCIINSLKFKDNVQEELDLSLEERQKRQKKYLMQNLP